MSEYAKSVLARFGFVTDEDGAVTVDWVVLTAGIVTVGLIVMQIIRGGVYDAASDIYSSLTNAINLN